MSDLLKNVSFLGDEATSPSADDIVVKPAGDPPVLRRSADPLAPKTVSAAQAPIRQVIAHAEPEPPTRTPLWAGIVLSVFTAIAIAAWMFGYFGERSGALSPWDYVGLFTAVVVPAAAVFTLFAALRALSEARTESARLAAISERLSRVDENVGAEVASLSGAIRSEIAAVDARLAQTRDQFEGFGAALSQQSRDLDATTATMAERSEIIGRALTLHRQAFESLANTFDAQMESLSAQIELQRGKLSDVTQRAQDDLGASQMSIETAAAALTDAVAAATGSSQAADASLEAARERMEGVIARIQNSATELDAVYERRAAHLASLADRLSGERDGTQTALLAQTERLAAVDAQIEITERSLTALVDHARSIHEGLLGQLSAIDKTLDNADHRTKEFTATMSERVADSVADARRDLSLMETDLRTLQSRLAEAKDDSLPLERPAQPAPKAPGRVHLKPLDTDFPPVEPPRAQPPKTVREVLAAQVEDDPLDLVEFVDDTPLTVEPIPDIEDAPVPTREVLRRPGEDLAPKGRKRRRSFGKAEPAPSAPAPSAAPASASLASPARDGWRWRDMLGGIDPVDASMAPVAAAAVSRPPAGIPLSAPTVPAAPTLPDGSDVVARLCEVQLAPSAIVDEGTIIEAGKAREMSGGPGMVAVTKNRLREPIVHLRGVLAADLEFKLRAQTFVRSFDASLQTPGTALRTELGSASGRAFLLCAAALSD